MTRSTVLAGLAGLLLLSACRAAAPLDAGPAEVRPAPPARAAAPDRPAAAGQADCAEGSEAGIGDSGCAPGYAFGVHVVTPGGRKFTPAAPQQAPAQAAVPPSAEVPGSPVAPGSPEPPGGAEVPGSPEAPGQRAPAAEPAPGPQVAEAPPPAEAEPRVKTAPSAPRASGTGGDAETALTLATPCRADGATQSSISVFCAVRDDADGDSTVTLEYRRQGASVWRAYHAPKRLKLDDEWIKPGADGILGTTDDVYDFRHYHNEADYNFGFFQTSCPAITDIDHSTKTCVYGPWSAMLNDLDAGTSYQVRVTFQDPDGVTESGASAQQTLSIVTPAVPNIWPATPRITTVRTAAELRRVVDAGLSAGDVVALKPGTYAFGREWRSEGACQGTAENPIVITGSTFWAWDVTITGARWFLTECRHFVIRDLSFHVDKQAIYFGRQFNDGRSAASHRNITIVRNAFESSSDYDHILEFWGTVGSTGLTGGSEDVYIADNLFQGPNAFPATSTQGGSAAIKLAGKNFQVEYNTIRGFVDGTKIGLSKDHKVGSIVLRNNRVDYGKDDAFEFDDVQSHMAVHDNLFTGTRGGLSWQAGWGDTYAFRNIGYGLGARSSPLKFKYGSGEDSGGYILVANNTFQKDGPSWLFSVDGTPTGIHVYNNLFLGEDHTLNHDGERVREALKAAGWNIGIDEDGDWDHNGWGYDGRFALNTFSGTSQNRQGNSADSFSAWQSEMVADLGWAANDIVLSVASEPNPASDADMTDDSYKPMFARPWPFNDANPTLDVALHGFASYRHTIHAGVLDRTAFEPASDSPLVDAGKALAGYTDGYVGAAPDIGAVESGNIKAGDYGERIGLDGTALKQLAAGLGQGYTGRGTIAANETRRYGGATPVAIHDSPEYAYTYKRGDVPTFDRGAGAANDAGSDDLIDTPADSIRQLIYENLSPADMSAWDAGKLNTGTTYIGTGNMRAGLYEVWCGWAKHGAKGVYMTCTGHGDGGDNAIYSFNFGTGAWARETPPAAKPTPGSAICDPADSGLTWTGVEGSASTQSAAHTYDGIHWIPTEGELLLTGGATTCGPAAGYPGYGWVWSPVGGHSAFYTAETTTIGTQLPSGAWSTDDEVFVATGQAVGTQAFDPVSDTLGAFTSRWINTLRAAQPQAVYLPASAFETQPTGMVVLADAEGVYGITLDARLQPPTPSRWHRCVQNVPADRGTAALDDVPFDQTGVAVDPVANELVFWNGEAAYYAMPITILDNCVAGDNDPTTWHNTDSADVNFSKTALTGTYTPLQSNYHTTDKQNLTYSKFDWFGVVTLADGTVIDNLMVGGNAQAEGVWVFRR